MRKKSLILASASLVSIGAYSQSKDRVEMADFMRSNGMIWVVVAVLVCIFAGLMIYLVRIDRKLKQVEKDVI